MSDKKTAAKETLPVKAMDAQVDNMIKQLETEKARMAQLEADKSEVNKAHAFLVGQNPNTPAGPKCMRLLDALGDIIKNQENVITNVENMISSCKAQHDFDVAHAVITHLSRKYEV